MRVRVLGCSGGIGGGRHTTCLLVDEDVLVDAGTGLTTLELDELRRIDHVFLTHSHLDHIASLPLLVDSVGHLRERPLRVYATRETAAILDEHLFNWRIWPDFRRIPSARAPYMVFEPVRVGTAVELSGGRRITPLPAEHVVPAVGYRVAGPGGSLVFSGDTAGCEAFWEAVNAMEDLRYLLIETAFPEERRDIARDSKHLSPVLLAQELSHLKRPAQICITHLKPGEDELIMKEIGARVSPRTPRALRQGEVLEI